MAQDGAVTFSSLTAEAGAPGIARDWAAMTAAAGSPGAEVSLSAMTVSAGSPGAEVSLSAMTATGAGTGASVALGDADFARATATGEGSAGSVAEGDADLAEMTAAGYGPMSTDISFEEMTAAATGLTGGVASSDARFEQMTAVVVHVGGSLATGVAQFAYPTASAASAETNVGTAAVSLQYLRASAAALNGTVASAAPSFDPLEVAAQALHVTVATAEPDFLYMTGRAVGGATLADTRRTWVVNAGNEAMTEYQNFDFDSYAEFNGSHYGAGPDGIVQLAGTDDAGADIAWSFRTGLIDGKNAMLKRLEEVLFATRFDGPLRVRIWVDDSTYFDYNVNNFRPDVVHQVRAKLGRGLKSRFYRVEVSGVGNVAAEFHSMQLPLIPLHRRVG